MKLDLIIIVVAVIIILAMILTVLYGNKSSRHGYGRNLPAVNDAALTYTA